jgi:hypothetical protein
MGGAYAWLQVSEWSFFWSFVALTVVSLGLAICGYYLVKPLALEMLYQSGFQYMTGAKVFDRRPRVKTQPFGIAPAANLDDEHSGSRVTI